MPGPYADLSDADLVQEIADYRAIQKDLAVGGGISEIAGEGRRIKYSLGSSTDISQILRELLAERDRRPSLGGGSTGGSFGIVIC